MPITRLFTFIHTTMAIGLSLLALSACGRTHDGAQSPLPYFDVECSIASHLLCDSQAHGAQVFVALTTEEESDCATLFALNRDYDLYSAFDYSGWSTLKDQGTYLSAEIKNWQTNRGNLAWNIDINGYKVCSFIDLNGNGSIDILEPFHESYYIAGQNFQPISVWQTY